MRKLKREREKGDNDQIDQSYCDSWGLYWRLKRPKVVSRKSYCWAYGLRGARKLLRIFGLDVVCERTCRVHTYGKLLAHIGTILALENNLAEHARHLLFEHH